MSLTDDAWINALVKQLRADRTNGMALDAAATIDALRRDIYEMVQHNRPPSTPPMSREALEEAERQVRTPNMPLDRARIIRDWFISISPDEIVLALVEDSSLILSIRQALGISDGVGLIAAERQRQVAVKGWTPEHDDTHTDGSLALAAGLLVSLSFGGEIVWPGDDNWVTQFVYEHQGDSPIRQLTIAGALVAAEIDRRQRKTERQGGTTPQEP